MTMLKNNLELLKKRYPEIYNEIKDIHVDSNAYQIIQNNEGQKTLKVTLDLYGENKASFCTVNIIRMLKQTDLRGNNTNRNFPYKFSTDLDWVIMLKKLPDF